VSREEDVIRRSPSAAIIGGGIGGLAAALALRRVGLAVKVYEQARGLTEVGAGVQLSPNGTRILARLGLTPAIERVAVAADSFEFRRWDDGRLVSDTPLGDAIRTRFGVGYYQIHRAGSIGSAQPRLTGRLR
jgi:salicylate hydroxylase